MPNVDDFLYYDRQTGVITFVGNAPLDAIRATSAQGYIKGVKADPDTQCVDLETKTVVDKAQFESGVYHQDEYRMNVPAGTIARFDGQVYEVDGTELTIVLSMPGEYELSLYHPMYQSKVITLENPNA